MQDGIEPGAGLIEPGATPGHALANLPAPGIPAALLQHAGLPLATVDGANLLNRTLPPVPLRQAIASGAFGMTGASARLLSEIRTFAMPP
ncbi:hypothetical protein [Burkholderia sp. JKS000303]|uniref:hypothetical protein n=1 Tax=Burkholderia sp. JKS000303 TaxID=1938747 RepID=UPI000BF6C451|nr:hypothetical protein [Burkholderia sp. JKS000303]